MVPNRFDPGERFEHTPDKARQLLSSLWERNLPVVRERVEELQDAVAHARAGTLRDDERESACGTAHKLAGSLGMFGYPRGTDAARRIEQQMEGDGHLDLDSLDASVSALQAALPL